LDKLPNEISDDEEGAFEVGTVVSVEGAFEVGTVVSVEGAFEVGALIFMVGSEVRTLVEGAFVVGALVEGAFVVGALVEGAFVVGTVVEGAFVVGTLVEGAFVVGTVVEGAFEAGALVFLVGSEVGCPDSARVGGQETKTHRQLASSHLSQFAHVESQVPFLSPWLR
jgi:hypothetical protein